MVFLFLGLGDCGLGIGDWGLGPIPNPQSLILLCKNKFYNYFNKINDFKYIKNYPLIYFCPSPSFNI